MAKCLELIGKRFTRLTVVSRAENDKGGSSRWDCVCDCGNTVTVAVRNLTSGRQKSCGCYKKDMLAKARECRRYYRS